MPLKFRQNGQWVDVASSNTSSNVVVNQDNYNCTNPITVNGSTIGIGTTSNAYGTRYVEDHLPLPSDGCDGDLWYYTAGSVGDIIIGAATTAINVEITSVSTNSTHYLHFGDKTSGNDDVNVNTNILCNPFGGTISAQNITSNSQVGVYLGSSIDAAYGVLQYDGNIVSNRLSSATGDQYSFAIRRGSNSLGVFNIIENKEDAYVRIETTNIAGTDEIARDLIISSSKTIKCEGETIPFANNTYRLGNSGTRWSEIWTNSATINTSDYREKTGITTSVLGLDFINRLNPVSYKWIVGQNELQWDENGVIVTDENGDRVTIPKPGIRKHYGLISQEVKQVLDDIGLEGEDFAGWVLNDKNDPNSFQSLRYTEFIAPMIKAIQEQQIMIEELKNQIDQLKKNIQ